MPAVRGGKGQDRRCCLLQGNPGGGGPTAGLGAVARVGEDGTEETPGASAEVSPDGHIGPKGPRWVTSVHFPSQIEFELLLFPGSRHHRGLLENQGWMLPLPAAWTIIPFPFPCRPRVVS